MFCKELRIRRRKGFFGRKISNGFGRAVSRILSSLLRAERIICLSSQYPGPVRFREPERAAPGSPIWPCTRWGLPCLVACASSGGLLHHLFTLTRFLRTGRYLLCGTFRRDASRHHLPRVSPPETELRGIAPFGVRTFLLRLAPEAILHPSKTGKTIARRVGENKSARESLFRSNIAF